ncbi:hypothetical protein FEAC_28610 [Ferrimicrobium acidiphilum DSM 19497]|uniref:Uncharacterized protein n=1 Tax=Ferrimicrobium acidiphilum DSM 19497 TaxID=1121877 RepID=A0A0D8FQR6_9ACTN|nr:hypothetical protein FEAC_29550 [Ferrimicrobium acidiphilum DSM 19497]KJE75419.1 hypothetical protein FEAC_28610 [Ferrimicrobium acidiphilum DSM 19497]
MSSFHVAESERVSTLTSETESSSPSEQASIGPSSIVASRCLLGTGCGPVGAGRVISPSAAILASATLADISFNPPSGFVHPRDRQSAREIDARVGYAGSKQRVRTISISTSVNSRPT